MPDILPHAGAALVIAFVALAVARRLTRTRSLLFAAFTVPAVLMLLPITDFAASHYLRVLTGDLSMTSLIWLSCVALVVIWTGKRDVEEQEIQLAVLVTLFAFVFYPSSLGVSPFDLYGPGFQPTILGPFLLVIFAASVWLGAWLPAISIVAGLAAYHFRLLESDNLWDYILDPVLTIYCVAILVTNRQRLLGGNANPIS